MLLILGAVIGTVSAFFGIGGGFAITPFLHSVVYLPASFAVATSMGQIPFMSLSGALAYSKSRQIRYRQGLWLVAGALPASQAMAWLIKAAGNSEWASQEAFKDTEIADLLLLLLFCAVIGSVGFYNLRRSFHLNSKGQQPLFQSRSAQDLAAAAMGILLGLIAALLGMGGGFFAVPFFVYLCGFKPVEAVATSLFATVIISSVTTLHYILADQIYLALSLSIGCGAIIGARIGARSAMRAPPQILLRWLGILQLSVVFCYIASRLI